MIVSPRARYGLFVMIAAATLAHMALWGRIERCSSFNHQRSEENRERIVELEHRIAFLEERP